MSFDPPPSVVPLAPEGRPDAIWKIWLNNIYELFGGTLWDDNLTSLFTARPGGTAPTLRSFGPTGTNQQWDFGVNDFMHTGGIHITHDIKIGSKIYPHVHWSTNGTDTNTVKWELSYTIAKGHNQEAFPADTILNLEQAGSGTAWQHMIVEATDAEAIDAPEIDSLIIMRVRRVTNGGTDNGDQVFGLFVDMHYQKDRFGTRYKSPDFYKR